MKRIKLWHWGALLIVAAMSTLIYLGWKGLAGQRALIMQDVDRDCQQWARTIADALPDKIGLYQRIIPTYDYPPQPGNIGFNPKADEATLKQWQDEGGVTQAGLPVNILASLELFHRKPSGQAATELAESACLRSPSPITPKILQILEETCNQPYWGYNSKKWNTLWKQAETARALAEPQVSPSWQAYKGKLWYIDSTDKSLVKYISPHDADRMFSYITRNRLSLPQWAGAKFEIRGAQSGNAGQLPGSHFTMSPHLSIKVGVINEDLLYATWHATRRLNISMMILASIGLIGGIYVIAIGEAKEKKTDSSPEQFHRQCHSRTPGTRRINAPDGRVTRSRKGLSLQSKRVPPASGPRRRPDSLT